MQWKSRVVDMERVISDIAYKVADELDSIDDKDLEVLVFRAFFLHNKSA